MDCKNIRKASLPGFSLIEISIVLLIIGIIAGATLKGKDMINTAKLKSVATDMQVLQLAFQEYGNLYNTLPGDDKSASAKFPGAANGDGDGKFSEEDAGKVFSHLFRAGLIESETFKVPKISGKYELIVENNVLKLKLSKAGAAFLTGKQIIALIAKCHEILGNEDIIETDPSELSQDASQKYIVKVKIY
ncbi:MAG: type II secretion system GspH family protein [Holosporales bacterium]|jgi:prepilin-type N-terminal cleavage/methylation domain-containing protein|nr:type II secretion system GspH family protein [Holosporales bacterium]